MQSKEESNEEMDAQFDSLLEAVSGKII